MGLSVVEYSLDRSSFNSDPEPRYVPRKYLVSITVTDQKKKAYVYVSDTFELIFLD